MSVSEELDYQETIALLQEEVVRLENELRLRDEAGSDDRRHEGSDAAIDGAASRQVASLLDELANREETINLLLEQARLFEEAESADRANWDQLNHWVQELEQRVESGGGSSGLMQEALEDERRKAGSEREAFQAERRAWDAQRKAMESEAEKLQGMLARAAQQPDAAGDSVAKGLEQENRRLRAAMSELARVSAAAAEADSLRERLATTQGELAQTTRTLQELLDEHGRERKEHEALVNELRSQVARESLKRQETQVLNAVVPAGKKDGSAMSPDDRIRAFRQHLKEIHEKEAEERAQRKISARLSRLWRKTGPRG
jgi:hypothetical protein